MLDQTAFIVMGAMAETMQSVCYHGPLECLLLVCLFSGLKPGLASGLIQ